MRFRKASHNTKSATRLELFARQHRSSLTESEAALLGSRLVLAPEQLQRDANAAELSVHPFEVDGCSRRRLAAADVAEQTGLDLGVAKWLGLLPGQPSALGVPQVVADRRRRHLASHGTARKWCRGSPLTRTYCSGCSSGRRCASSSSIKLPNRPVSGTSSIIGTAEDRTVWRRARASPDSPRECWGRLLARAVHWTGRRRLAQGGSV
jgi:hypothetical protein